jgi:ABC-type branched-subunit amino acid transport system substrate-binding protein
MRKSFVLILMLSVFTFACNETVQEKKSKRDREIPKYTIGINLPLTGNGSYFAEELKKGLDLTFNYLNSQPGKMVLQVIYEDNKLNPKDAVTIAKKFLEIDEVDLIISGYTPIIQATIGLVDQHKVPMLLTLSSAEYIASPYEWAFRDFELESDNMPMLATYAFSTLGVQKGSWLVVNDDMGSDAIRFFSEKFVEEGGTMMAGEVFESSDLDLRNKINKIMVNDPEFIIVIGRGSAMINACRQIRERNQDIPILSNNTIDNDMVWNALGEFSNNIWFPRPYVDFSSSLYKTANDDFRKEYGYDMNWLNIYGMSIAGYLAKGLKDSKGDKEYMRNYLKTLDIQSIRGRLIMNGHSDVSIPHLVYKRIDGKSIPAEEVISYTE